MASTPVNFTKTKEYRSVLKRHPIKRGPRSKAAKMAEFDALHCALHKRATWEREPDFWTIKKVLKKQHRRRRSKHYV